MIFRESNLKGLWLVTLEPRLDERGFFVRTYCDEEFSKQGLNTHWPQSNHTLTRDKGAIRGLHFQAQPHPEIKTVRCVRGAIFDVAVDVRPTSPTFGRWEAFELTPTNNQVLYIGAGFAHGFQTLEPNSEVLYQMSDSYYSDLSGGVRYDDPEIRIRWPFLVTIVSERDRGLPLLAELPLKNSGPEKKVD
jgi:dTDP-4-dehydrorhamnose 3,5-epimerase